MLPHTGLTDDDILRPKMSRLWGQMMPMNWQMRVQEVSRQRKLGFCVLIRQCNPYFHRTPPSLGFKEGVGVFFTLPLNFVLLFFYGVWHIHFSTHGNKDAVDLKTDFELILDSRYSACLTVSGYLLSDQDNQATGHQ